MRASLFLLSALFISTGATVCGQQGGGSGGSGGRGGGLPPLPTLQPPSQELDMNHTTRPVFLSGHVFLPDGSPPPEAVVVQKVCNGYTRNEAWTDSRGAFSFQLGKESADLQDLSQDSNQDPDRVQSVGSIDLSRPVTQPETKLSGCTLQAYLPGYRSESLLLTARDAMEKPDIGTIYLRRMGEVEGQVVSATTLMAPKPARKAFDKGEGAAKKMHWNEAARDFREAIREYPEYADAWYDLGQILQQLNAVPDSIAAYRAAVKADRRFLKPYQPLVMLQIRQEDWAEAQRYASAWIGLDRVDFPQAYLLHAFASVKLNKLDDAERSAREGYRLDHQQRYPRMSWLLGCILAQKSNFSEAARYFREYLKLSPGAADAMAVEQQVAAIEQTPPRTAHE